MKAHADCDSQANVMACPLCGHTGVAVPKTAFYLCIECRGFYRHSLDLPDLDEEKARYETHQNDVDDSGYQQFVSPIVSSVLRDFTPEHSGLDFGAGPGPVISKLLRDKGYNIVQYDPFFHNHPKLLDKTYDYIVCCEVIEHFHSPDKEFSLLKRMLKPPGKLYCMTYLFRPEIDFSNWFYIRDLTHVFIYQPITMEWIKQHYGFFSCTIENRLITLENAPGVRIGDASAGRQGFKGSQRFTKTGAIPLISAETAPANSAFTLYNLED